MQDEHLQMLQTFMTKKDWPAHLSKQDGNFFRSLADKAFQDKNKLVWVRLTDFNYPWTALYLLSKYHNEAICEAHDSIFGGHNVTQKTYLKISTSFYWPKIIQEIERHKNFCLRCLCITDAFTKYAVVTAIANKDAEMVADAIYKEWFS